MVSSSDRSGISATDSYPSPLHRFLVRLWRSFSVLVARSSVVQFVQKLPPCEKNGKEGSVRPCKTFPHMHSMIGYPEWSLIIVPSVFLAQREFSS